MWWGVKRDENGSKDTLNDRKKDRQNNSSKEIDRPAKRTAHKRASEQVIWAQKSRFALAWFRVVETDSYVLHYFRFQKTLIARFISLSRWSIDAIICWFTFVQCLARFIFCLCICSTLYKLLVRTKCPISVFDCPTTIWPPIECAVMPSKYPICLLKFSIPLRKIIINDTLW